MAPVDAESDRAAAVALPLLRSTGLGTAFVHGFSTRVGGVSPAPYDSLNMSGRWGDSQANVAENRRRMQRALGADDLFLIRQVHGAGVARVTNATAATEQPEADAVVTNRPGAAVGVFTADCVPLLMGDPTTGAVAAVHAGWRGVVAGVAPAALAALRAHHGSRPGDVRVALGPAIGACCFEVGPDVVAAFATAFPGALDQLVTSGGRGRPHIDLRRALFLQLTAAGIEAQNLDLGSACTMCNPARFFSYRRDNTQTGQHLSIIVAPA